MTISKGKCKGCERDDIEVYDQNEKCIICTRLDAHDGLLNKLYETLIEATKAIKALERFRGQ